MAQFNRNQRCFIALWKWHVCIHNPHTWANLFMRLMSAKGLGFTVIIKQIIHVDTNICWAAQQCSSKLLFLPLRAKRCDGRPSAVTKSRAQNGSEYESATKRSAIERSHVWRQGFPQRTHTLLLIHRMCASLAGELERFASASIAFIIIALSCGIVCSFVVSLIKLVKEDGSD